MKLLHSIVIRVNMKIDSLAVTWPGPSSATCNAKVLAVQIESNFLAVMTIECSSFVRELPIKTVKPASLIIFLHIRGQFESQYYLDT